MVRMMFDDINTDFHSGISRDIRISYWLDWLGFFQKGKDSIEATEFVFFFKEEMQKNIESLILYKKDYESTRIAYYDFYNSELDRFKKSKNLPITRYKLDTIIKAVIYIELAYKAFQENQFYISLEFYQNYTFVKGQIIVYEGFSNDEVKEKGWRRSDRADNEQKNKLKSEGRELAKQIIVIDSKKQNILTLLDIGEIIHDYLSYLYPAEKISESNQIRKKWLTGVKSVSKGRPKGNTDKRDYKLEILEILKQSKK